MADQEIKTGIDALVAYLNEHGETNVSVIAAALGVGESAVLEWANVLEKANIITVSHRAGRLFIAPLTGATKGTKETKQAEQSRTETMISSDLAAVDQISADLELFTKSLGSIDELFNTKYRNAKAMLDKLNGIDASMAKVEKDIEAKAAYIRNVSEKSQEQFEAAKRHMENLANFSLDTNNAKAVAQELKDLLKAYDKNTSDLSKGLDLVIYQYRKNALNFSRNIKEKHRQLVEVMSFDQKQIREYEKLNQDYKREQATLTRQANYINRHVLDEITKGKAELARLIELSKVQINSIRPKVADIKNDLGGLAQLNSHILEIRTELGELTKQRDSLLAELKKMQQEARSGENLKKVSERSREISGTITTIRGNIEKLKGDLGGMGEKKGKGGI